MRVKSQAIECIHLDPGYALLSVQNILTVKEYFRLLDVHYHGSINDVQFWIMANEITDLSKEYAEALFHLLDVDHSGEMDFEEFYLVFCIMIACKDKYEKEFIYRHSNSIFKLIDADASGLVSKSEFCQMGVLFNFDAYSISTIFNEFDISGDKNLDFTEFRLFTMACIDEQRSNESLLKVEAFSNYQKRLMASLRTILMRYVRTNYLPTPSKVAKRVNTVQLPQMDERKRWRKWWDPEYFHYIFDKSIRGFIFVISFCWHFIVDPPVRLFKSIRAKCKRKFNRRKNRAVAKRRIDIKTKRRIFSYKYYNRNMKAGNFTYGNQAGIANLFDADMINSARRDSLPSREQSQSSLAFTGTSNLQSLSTKEMEKEF